MFSVSCVWTVSWIFYCISLGRFSCFGFLTAVLIVLFFIWSVCLSVSTHYCVNKKKITIIIIDIDDVTSAHVAYA